MPTGEPVMAEINYLGEMDEKPLSYSHNREKGNLVLDGHVMQVQDIRRSNTTLEKEGVILADLAMDFDGDLDAAPEKFRSAFANHIHDMTGAGKIIVLPPILRWSEPPDPNKVVSSPAPYVHCDFTLDSFHLIMSQVVADDPQKDRWLGGRYALYQTWLALSPPPQDKPLAVIDRSTVDPADLVDGAVMVGPPDNVARYPAVFSRYNPAHRWYYVSDMTPRDALIFVGCDSGYDTLPGALHTAFQNTACGDRVIPRISCETRAFIFWGD
ncbi:MAG TPA: CmcJ/NvfI family oxidoreductase [Sphingobium sp.]|nr:CmcJ/NvfI family oxidoreductase [Sphingobium sp.]